VLALSLRDASGRDLHSALLDIRIEPDLWEQIFLVRAPFLDHRLASIGAVADLLSRIGPLPVAPLASFDATDSVAIEARLAVQPLAQTEVRRVQALFWGDDAPGDAGRQEVSVGLLPLLRALLGDAGGERWIAVGHSPRFLAAETPHRGTPGLPSRQSGPANALREGR
jgi:hypothetical protein